VHEGENIGVDVSMIGLGKAVAAVLEYLRLGILDDFAHSAKTLTRNSDGRIASFDAFRFIDMIAPRPLLVMVGTEAVMSWMANEAFVAAREPNEVFRIGGEPCQSLRRGEAYRLSHREEQI